MKIVLFNHVDANIHPEIEAAYLPPHLFMADIVHYDSVISVIIMIYTYVDDYSDETIIELFEAFHEDNEEIDEYIEDIRDSFERAKGIRKIKHKDKNALVILGQLKSIFNDLRTDIKEQFTGMLETLNLNVFLPFFEKKVLILETGDLFSDENNENKLLTEISKILINNDVLLSLTDSIEINNPFDTLSSNSEEFCSFIKVPLWKFPHLLIKSFDLLNFTREQMLPVFKPFNENLRKLQNDFFTINFAPENLPLIKQKINKKIMPHLANIQKAIDESLYISNMKNTFSENSGMNFCLGIAPAETIVKYYQDTEIIQPFEASEIINRITRHNNLKATYIFTYFEKQNL